LLAGVRPEFPVRPGFASATFLVFFMSLIFYSVLQFLIVCGLLQGEASVVLELSDQKA
jgi:hypothetical protein